MGMVDYQAIYARNKHGWYDMTEEPEKHEALLAGHYSDSNHFVYELLQNAEDEKASKVVIEYYKDKLVFYHNGEPFDEADVRGVSSMLMGTKSRDDAQTIGRFGMGFKSVFKYTHQPEIYSDNEAFCIKSYLLPEEIDGGWDYIAEKDALAFKLGDGRNCFPFINEDHLTKIIIPFTKRKYDGSFESISGQDVVKKLEELNGEILLYLTYIKELYWVDKTRNQYALISLDRSEEDKNLYTCRIEGSSVGSKEDITKYLKFSKVFDHPEMKSANVSIAYKVNIRANNINETKDNYISVYFPTKDKTELPFLVHGSFETAVSRERLMEPSDFNNDLYDTLGDLICDSLVELKKRRLITQGFLRRVLLPSFNEERIKGLRQKVSERFRKEKLLPDANLNYYMASNMSIAVPFAIADFYSTELFVGTFRAVKAFVALNDEKGAGFTEYFTWLKDDLHINIFNLETWAKQLSRLKSRIILNKSKEYEDLIRLYSFLSDYKESLFERKSYSSRGNIYSRSGPYESMVKFCLVDAWKLLRKAPIILNIENYLMPAYRNEKAQIYLNSSSNYKKVVSSAIVNSSVAEEYKPLLEDGFKINEFDNFQYVKEKVIKKYIDIDGNINFNNYEDYEDEYIEDLKQIIKLIDDGHNLNEIQEMLREAYIIRIISSEGKVLFNLPSKSYIGKSDEEVDLEVYFKEINTRDEVIDEKFYNKNGISISKLKLFGLYTRIINEGVRKDSGSPYWRAQGDYCPRISVEFWDENIKYINENPDVELSKKKSSIMLNLLLSNHNKLLGKVEHNKMKVYIKTEKSMFLIHKIHYSPWIYNMSEELCYIKDISRFELNEDIYGFSKYSKDAYETLGFIQKEIDTRIDTYEAVDALEEREQRLLLQKLASKFGYSLDRSEVIEDEPEDNDGGTFRPEDWISKDFPNRRVRNKESLIKHVHQQFFCADPVKYQQVLRQIRTSRSTPSFREYAIGMYTNDDGVRICQLCKEPIHSVEVTEIANFGIEMDQLNLCFCRNCAARYKGLRDRNKDNFKQAIKEDICDMFISYDTEYYDKEEYELELSDEISIYFTQTHLAEINEIFELIGKYGLPNEKDEVDENLEFATGPIQHPIRRAIDEVAITLNEDFDDIVNDGSFIAYKNYTTGVCHEVTVEADKYPLHKRFVGNKAGDIVTLYGKKYEITCIL